MLWQVYLLGKQQTNQFLTGQLNQSRLATGPPVGGALYSRFGYRGPFVFSEVCILLDLVGRLLIIERKEAVIWGFDPTALSQDVKLEQIPLPNITSNADTSAEQHLQLPITSNLPKLNVADPESAVPSTSQITMSPDNQHHPTSGGVVPLIRSRSLSLLAVFIKLLKSPRALVALLLTLIYGYCHNYFSFLQ